MLEMEGALHNVSGMKREMAAILPMFRGRGLARRKTKPSPGEVGTITIFPGIRYERLPDDHVYASLDRQKQAEGKKKPERC